MNGYIKLYRQVIDNPIFQKDITAWHVFEVLMTLCDYRTGEWQGGRFRLAEYCGNMNPNTLKSAIDRLRTSKMITTTSTNKYTIYRICNWEKYQGDDTSNITNKTPGKHQENTTIKRNKEIKNNTYVELFNDLAKIIRSQANYSAAYEKLVKKALKDLGGRDELIAAAVYFDGQFKVEGSWHSKNQKYRTIAQFLGNNSNHIPRYQLCFEQAQVGQTNTPSEQGWKPDAEDEQWNEAMNNFREGDDDGTDN